MFFTPHPQLHIYSLTSKSRPWPIFLGCQRYCTRREVTQIKQPQSLHSPWLAAKLLLGRVGHFWFHWGQPWWRRNCHGFQVLTDLAGDPQRVGGWDLILGAALPLAVVAVGTVRTVAAALLPPFAKIYYHLGVGKWGIPCFPQFLGRWRWLPQFQTNPYQAIVSWLQCRDCLCTILYAELYWPFRQHLALMC